MVIPHLPGPSAYDSDSDTDEILERYDAYIIALARKKAPHNIMYPEVLGDEIDELAQTTRIKYWLISQKERIICPKAYIRSIIRSESVNMVRQRKPTLPLPTDENGELYQGNVMVKIGKGEQDPMYEIEREEVLADYISKAVDAILTLPPRQQRAMICSLKDQLEDILPLVDAFKEHGMDIEAVNWPAEKDEMQRLRASLSIARKKLRSQERKYNFDS